MYCVEHEFIFKPSFTFPDKNTPHTMGSKPREVSYCKNTSHFWFYNKIILNQMFFYSFLNNVFLFPLEFK